MYKKSQIMLISLFFQLLLVGLIVLSLFGAANKIREGTFFQQKAFSKNLALFYDAVASSPEKTEATYQIYPDYEMDTEITKNCLVKIKKELKSATLFDCALNLYSSTNCGKSIDCYYQKNYISFNKNG